MLCYDLVGHNPVYHWFMTGLVMYKIDVRRHPSTSFQLLCLRPAVFTDTCRTPKPSAKSEIYRIVISVSTLTTDTFVLLHFSFLGKDSFPLKGYTPQSLRSKCSSTHERMRPPSLPSRSRGGTPDPTPPLDISTWRRVLMLRRASLSSPCAHGWDIGRETLFIGTVSPGCQLDESM